MKTVVQLSCEVCGKDFYVSPYRASTARFCSKQCSGYCGGKSVANRKGLFTKGHQTNLGKSMPSAGFPKGNTPWNKGAKLPAWYREKLSTSHRGQVAWNKGTGVRSKFSDLHEYRLWRVAVYKRDDYTCQICGIRGGKLNAHHVFPVCLFPDKVLDLDNGKTLCFSCHTKTDSFGVNATEKRRELQERLSKLTCSEAWEETLRNVQRLGAEATSAGNAPTSALAQAIG